MKHLKRPALLVAGLALMLLLDGCTARLVPSGTGSRSAVCHEGRTIEVDRSAVQIHLDHGDYAGPCR